MRKTVEKETREEKKRKIPGGQTPSHTISHEVRRKEWNIERRKVKAQREKVGEIIQEKLTTNKSGHSQLE